MEPVAYGLKFAGLFSGGTFLRGNFTSVLQATGVDATATRPSFLEDMRASSSSTKT
jgi:hypothetical protein